MGECRESETAQRYVAGRLSAIEAERFELHVLTCERCQTEVRLGDAIASVRTPRQAEPDPPEARPTTTPVRTPRRWVPVMAVPIIAAAAAVAFLVTRPESPDLGAVIAPVFVGAPVRSTGLSTPTDDGIAAYASADYGRAADLLGRASASDSSPAVGFYLGLARLLTGDANGALEALALPRSADGSPYQFDAALFAAKAHVRLGRDDSAVAILRAIPAGSAAAARARAFSDSILARRK